MLDGTFDFFGNKIVDIWLHATLWYCHTHGKIFGVTALFSLYLKVLNTLFPRHVLGYI